MERYCFIDCNKKLGYNELIIYLINTDQLPIINSIINYVNVRRKDYSLVQLRYFREVLEERLEILM